MMRLRFFGCAALASILAVNFAQGQAPFEIQPKDTDIAKLYMALLDRDMEAYLGKIDAQTGLLTIPIPESVTPGMKEVHTRSLSDRAGLARDPNYNWSYRQSRGTAELAGALGYAYSMKQSKHYKSLEALNALRGIFDAFAAAQSPEGEFIFSTVRYSTVWGSHEMAWRLEPLITAYSLVKNDLPEGERKTVEAMLNQGVEFLAKNPDEGESFQGMVWSGVMALAARYSGDDAYQKAAEQRFQKIRPMFKEDGQVLVGPGPDLVESGVAIQYLFLYRLMSERGDLDSIIMPCLDWHSRLYTFHAIPLEGMSVHNQQFKGIQVASLLGALTFYGTKQPSFMQIATRYLEALITKSSAFAPSFGSSHFLRGALFHQRPAELLEIPYEPYARMYSSGHSLYFLVGKNYQAALTLRGRLPMKGLQTWAYKGQPPVIAPSENHRSQVMGFGFNSSLLDSQWRRESPPFRHTSLDGGIDVVGCTQGELTTAYVFSQDLTVAIFHDLSDRTVVDWVMKTPVCAQIVDVNPKAIAFGDTEAKLLLPDTQPDLITNEESVIVRTRYTGDFSWHTFAGPKSAAVVQPVVDRIILVQLNEDEVRSNLVVNLSTSPYSVSRKFPGTDIEIPQLEGLEAKRIEN